MKTIYFSDYCGEYGEAQAIFDEDGSLLGQWFCDDGNWRSEYFDGFLNKLGIVVDYSGVCDDKFNKLLKEQCGG